MQLPENGERRGNLFIGVGGHGRDAQPRRAGRDRRRADALHKDSLSEQEAASGHRPALVAEEQRENLALPRLDVETDLCQSFPQAADVPPLGLDRGGCLR